MKKSSNKASTPICGKPNPLAQRSRKQAQMQPLAVIKLQKNNMEKDKFQTLHPGGKKGVNLSLDKYIQIKKFIIDTLSANSEITFEDLAEHAVLILKDKFDGSVLWYITTVKLDLEARGIIERVPKTSPHKLKLARDER
jgi:hypothetical protein